MEKNYVVVVIMRIVEMKYEKDVNVLSWNNPI